MMSKEKEKMRTFYIGYGGCVINARTAKEALEIADSKAPHDWETYVIGMEGERNE